MYQDNEWKYVAVLNRTIPGWQAMNALAHGANALSAALRNEPPVRFVPYASSSGILLGEISQWPYIILEAPSSRKIAELGARLREQGLPVVEFTSSMFGASSELQQLQTRTAEESLLERVGVFTFGRAEFIDPLLKRFSVFRGFRGDTPEGPAKEGPVYAGRTPI